MQTDLRLAMRCVMHRLRSATRTFSVETRWKLTFSSQSRFSFVFKFRKIWKLCKLVCSYALNLPVRDTAKSPYASHNGKDVNSDCLADQWDEQNALERGLSYKGTVTGQ